MANNSSFPGVAEISAAISSAACAARAEMDNGISLRANRNKHLCLFRMAASEAERGVIFRPISADSWGRMFG